MALPHHHLNMLSVRTTRRRGGFARPLLHAVHRLAEEHHGSAGVSLATEVESNAGLYRHFGYTVLGHAEVEGALRSWSRWRPSLRAGGTGRP